MNKAEIIARIQEPGIVAIIRADSSEQLLEASKALLEGGVTTMEITMTTPNALQVIYEVTQALGDKILMGVGTVLEPHTAEEAVNAGAQFVVTPAFRPAVIEFCHRNEIPIASGAMTPTEALFTHEAGADFVKLFPADNLGPGFIRNLLAPLPMLKIIPTGGVTPANAAEFLAAGSVALGAGSSLVSKEILKNADWQKLTAHAAEFVAAVNKARNLS